MAKTTFFLRSKKDPATIYVSFSVRAGMAFKKKTGFVINSDDWNERNSLPKQTNEDLKELHTTLKKLALFIEDGLNKLTGSGEDPSGEWLEGKIDEFTGKKRRTDQDRLINYFQKYIDHLPYKEFPNGRKGATLATIGKYKTLKGKIENFEQYCNRKFYLKDVNQNFRNDFIKYLREVDQLGSNTAGRYIKFLKTVCLDAQYNGLEVNPQMKQLKGFTEKTPKIYLSFDELEKIESIIYDRPALENAKDWLIIGCYIGQRVSDLLKLTSENIVFRAGLELIEMTQTKTGKFVSIPLHPKVKAILEKYGGQFPYKISDQRFNEYIKDVCKVAGLTQPVFGGKSVKIRKDVYRKQFDNFPKYELVTSHICRRSFATNFYGEIPTALLIGITAHSTEQQFLAYIGKTSNDYAVQIAEFWRKQSLQEMKEPQLTVIKKAQ